MVSAVITTHNRCELLLKAIESVKKQTYRDIEIIVVDDASNDDTLDKCKDIKGLKYIRINTSRGGNYARNIGIKNSSGYYIAFLDDDDEWYPTKIEKQLDVFKKNQNIGMVYCNIHVDYGVRGLEYDVFFDNECQGNIVEKRMFWKPLCVTSSMVVKRDILKSVGLFDEDLSYWQEYELSLRIIQNCEIEFVNNPLVKYRKTIKKGVTLTNNYDNWIEAVDYINLKHKKLYDLLTEDEQMKRKEYFLKEAAYRSSMVENQCNMIAYYKELYLLTHKIQYFLCALFKISRQKSLYLEILIKKLLGYKKKIFENRS